MARPAELDTAALESDLCSRVDGEVRFDAAALGAYATDSSNYRQVPVAVVVPRSVEAGAAAIAVCRAHGAPVLSRGGGTSLAGQSTNTAVVVDWSKHCDRLLSVDTEARTCVVEPGIVLDELNAKLAPQGLEFGPRPSTHSHCTIGGMIGNNSCGSTAQRAGKTADNVRRLEVLTYGGLRCWVGATTEAEYAEVVDGGGARAELYRELRAVRDRHLGEIRRRFPAIPRRVSGYNLDALLPENGFDIAELLVGSESTLATVLRAELELVPVVPHKATVVIGYPDIASAADAVPGVNRAADPVQVEALDNRLLAFMRQEREHAESAALLPEGHAWLVVRYGGATPDAAGSTARAALGLLGKHPDDADVLVSTEPDEQKLLMMARESALGVTSRAPLMPHTWPGWEDSAVPPDRLGDYLRELMALYERYGYERPSLYGHFGQGCVHVRTPFRLDEATGVADFRRFTSDAADLVVSYGGSLSGEHGDGQARGELLERMFGSEIIAAFHQVKTLFDPDNRMNPGKVVWPARVDEHLRLGPSFRPVLQSTQFGYPEDGNDFGEAVLRCVGVGQCRRPAPEGGVMCPSYQVTRDEEHSTRGRARLLFEMLRGHDDSPVRDGWRSTAVRDALDLCLACKGCLSDCPVNVDMATYKAEFLAQHYRGRVRPMSHYSMGWLPLLAKAAAKTPRAVNALLHAPGLARLGKRLAGIAVERDAPRFAQETFQAWWTRTGRAGREPRPGEPDTVLLWPDTFTNHFHPHVAKAAVRVLESAGFRVAVPGQALCCGLTWISTGQLATAKRVLGRTVAALRPWLDAGALVVGLEPSCTAVFRVDASGLLPADYDVKRLSGRVATLAEALLHHSPRPWRPEQVNRRAVVQKHCHHHAVMGFATDETAMRRAGVVPEVLDSGCCGLAGNFGFEAGHHDVSMACAEQALFPALRETDVDALVLADGFSCRTQIEHGGFGSRAVHLAEALAPESDAEPAQKPSPLRRVADRVRSRLRR